MPFSFKLILTAIFWLMCLLASAQNRPADHIILQFKILGDTSATGESFMTTLTAKNIHIKYPEEARKNNVTGTVHYSFKFDQYCNITDVTILSGPGHGLNEYSMELIQNAGIEIIYNGNKMENCAVLQLVYPNNTFTSVFTYQLQ